MFEPERERGGGDDFGAARQPGNYVMNDARQTPGCLPEGYTEDSLLTVPQFALWVGLVERVVRKKLPNLPGVIRRSERDVRIHPRTYLAGAIKRK